MSSNSYGNEPAFPVTPAGEAITETDGQSAETHLHATAQHYGMSKRELFAGLAMQGILASTGSAASAPHRHTLARVSVDYANALCAELAKGGAQ